MIGSVSGGGGLYNLGTIIVWLGEIIVLYKCINEMNGTKKLGLRWWDLCNRG